MTKIPNDDMEKMTGREIFGIADIIGVLGDDFSNIYCVDCKTKNIEIYRYENENVGVKEILNEKILMKRRYMAILRPMYTWMIRKR